MRVRFRSSRRSALASPAAYAWDFQNDDGTFTGSWDTTLTYGQAWRIESRDCRLIAIADGGCGRSPNIDDGDLNYDTDMFSRALKVLTELSLNYRGVGAFVRASALYDDAADQTRSARRSSDESEDLVQSYTRLLDAFVLRQVRPRQDGRRAAPRPPGGELGREHLHPERHQRHQPLRRVGAARAGLGTQGSASCRRRWSNFSLQFNDNLSAQAIYLTDWNATVPEPAGSYFSSNDFAPTGGSKRGARLRLVLRPGRRLPPARRPATSPTSRP